MGTTQGTPCSLRVVLTSGLVVEDLAPDNAASVAVNDEQPGVVVPAVHHAQVLPHADYLIHPDLFVVHLDKAEVDGSFRQGWVGLVSWCVQLMSCSASVALGWLGSCWLEMFQLNWIR